MTTFLSAVFLVFVNFNYAQAAISEMTQLELEQALQGHDRCSLSPSNDVASQSGVRVYVVAAETMSGDIVYFAEVFQDESESYIYYLPKTHLTLGGYKSEGDRSWYLGFKIVASVNYLSQMGGGSGTDVKVEISDHLMASMASYYAYCEF